MSAGCRAAALGKGSTSSSVTMLAAGRLVFFFFQLPFVKLRTFLFLILPRGCFFVCLVVKECWMLLNAFSASTEMTL